MGGFEELYRALERLVRVLADGPVPLAARIAIAAILLAAGIYKLRHPLIAATAAVNFRMVGRPSRIVGVGLGLIEFFAAGMLVVPLPAVAIAGCVAAGMLSVGYVVVISVALLATQRFECHCLPGLDGNVSPATLTRAIAMVVGAIVGATPLVGGVAQDTGATLPAIGLAAAFVGMPLVVFSAIRDWQARRVLMAKIDWTWVLAVHEGRAGAPMQASEES